MPKKSTPPSTAPVAPAVLPMAEILKLSQREQCARFAERATVQQRAFAEMGKLHHAISASLKKGQTIYGELRKVGVKDSTISNASYASKVFALVAAKHLHEPEFDTLTFHDCLTICRVMDEKSARKLSGEEVAIVIRAKPSDFDAELESIFNTGYTVEEAVAQAKAESDRKAAAEAEAKKKAEAEAAEKADKEKQAAVAEALEKERKERESAPSAPTAPNPSESRLHDADASGVKPPVEVPPAIETAPESEKETPQPAPAESPAPASNVVQIRPAPSNADDSLPDVLLAFDQLLETATEMSTEAKRAVFEKVNACMAALAEQLNAEIQSAA